jgi:hypothetical protein
MYRLKATDAGSAGDVPATIRNYVVSAPALLTVAAFPGGDTDTAMTTSGTKYMTIPNSSSIIPGTISTMTLEAWVKPSSTCDTATPCTIMAVEASYLLQVFNGKIIYYIGSGSAWCDGAGGKFPPDAYVPSDKWTHVALVRNGAIVKIYINGQLRSTITSSCSPTTQAANTNAFNIGSRSLNNQPFPGSIDEVRMWSTDRSTNVASDMHSNETSTSGLLNYWNFNEGSGTVAYNAVPGALASTDLTVTDATTWNSSVVSDVTVGAAYTTKTFYRSYITSNGGWKVPSTVTKFSALIVGGGGGGGYNSGGGGGGGGVNYIPTLTLGSVQSISVGAGGAAADSTGSLPTTGGTSTLGASSAVGGNAGGNYPTSQAGGTGIVASAGTSGGGGTGAVSASYSGTAGSPGISNSISGSAVTYAGGGGGGGWNGNTGGGAGGAGGGG